MDSANSLYAESAGLALSGGRYDDVIALSDIEIIGNINLNAGTNRLEILGDTRLDGNIYAEGGVNEVKIKSGFFVPEGTVHVSDLQNKPLEVAAGAGFAFELYEDVSSELNSKLAVDGKISVANDTILIGRAGGGKTVNDLFGNRYEVITADEIDGFFVAQQRSMFDWAIDQTATNVTMMATGVKTQCGESTPSGNSVVKAAAHSAQLVMADLSARSREMRSLVRFAPASASPETQRLTDGNWALYVRQFNDLGAQDSDGSLAGFDWQTSGVTVGAERLFSPRLILGAAAGGTWTDLDGKEDAAGGSSKMAMINLYGNWFADRWFAEVGFSYAHAWNTSRRIATDAQRYSGDSESDLYGTWMEAGYTLSSEKYKIEPYFRTSYISGNHDAYTDHGGSDPLSVRGNGTDNWLTETGLRTSRNWAMVNGDLLGLELKAAWQCELLDQAVRANGSLLGIDQMLESPASDRNALAMGIKVDWQTRDAVSLGIEYAPNLSGNWYNHSVSASIKVQF